MQGGGEKSSQGHKHNINNKNSRKLISFVNNIFIMVLEPSLCQVPASIFLKISQLNLLKTFQNETYSVCLNFLPWLFW
jgi:hypothetical protein